MDPTHRNRFVCLQFCNETCCVHLLCVVVWWCQYVCATVCDSSADVISLPLVHGQASLAARGREGKGRTEGTVGHASIYNTEHFGLAFVAGQL